mmetsp:Transcript_48650/g.80688  ORF Transcript_48650/g.80688 Transcript_48650/m.80688 type:complete len:114 (-) Transcript_48650:41-382(-)
MGMQVGQRVTVRYCACFPQCSAKEMGGMGCGGACYCSPCVICCCVGFLPCAMFLVLATFAVLWIANGVDLAVLTLVCMFALCAIPCCLYYVMGDCAAVTASAGYEQAPQSANI